VLSESPSPPHNSQPNLGLVCITIGDRVRFRTITRKRLLQFSEPEQQEILRDLYQDNLVRLQNALDFCLLHNIKLYRYPTGIFPFADTPVGAGVLTEQYVVLSSESPEVVANSIMILESQAWIMDLLDQPRTPWALIEVHGGKRGRKEVLAAVIQTLSAPIRCRLGLENDEYAYSAQEILEVCQATGVPMIFDAHHHVLKEGLDSYDHPSVAAMVEAARTTWPDPAWQLVHLSNGREHFGDRSHSDLITDLPPTYTSVPWIEVEAKHKEEAISQMRRDWRTLTR
jgi:UV DNA damage endonuclease